MEAKELIKQALRGGNLDWDHAVIVRYQTKAVITVKSKLYPLKGIDITMKDLLGESTSDSKGIGFAKSDISRVEWAVRHGETLPSISGWVVVESEIDADAEMIELFMARWTAAQKLEDERNAKLRAVAHNRAQNSILEII